MDLAQIGKYKILEKIGQGAMGEVFRAHDTVLSRYVAVKTMSAAIGQDAELRKRFHREAQSAARLNHPNIITLYDFGEDQGRVYMAMELLEGTDVKDLINQQSLSLEEKLVLMEQVCDGLAFAHAAGVVHRDLKPANVHVQPNGQVKIMDFGLARLGTSEMTRTGMVMGTPHYMSPEQVRGQRADSRSDVFSLGSVFYELLSNHKAFDAESLHAVLFQVLEHEPEPVRHWVPDLPEVLVHFVEKALAKDPDLRFQNAGEMREALRVARQVLSGEVAEDVGLATILEIRVPEATIIGEADADATRAEPGSGPRVSGTAALDPARKGSMVAKGRTLSGTARTSPGLSGSRPGTLTKTPIPRASQTPIPRGSRTPIPGGTVSGTAATQLGPPGRRVQTRPPVAVAAPAPSRLPLYIGGAVALAGAVVVAVVLLGRKPVAPPVAPGPTGPDAATQMLIMTKVQLAEKNLEVKDYRAAISEADQVLKLDPVNAKAKDIRDKAEATLKDLDGAAAEAREAAQAGDFERASRALQRVMAIDPNHPVAGELSSRLNSRFKGQADEARQMMRRSMNAAEVARAQSLQAFRDADELYRQAEAELRKEEYTTATRKFLEARDGFDRARRTAQERVTPPTTIAVTPSTVAPPSLAPQTLPPTVPPAVPPPSLAPPTLPPTLPPTVAVHEEPAVRQVIADYERAIEQKDLVLYRRLKPNLSNAEENRLRQAFAAIEGHDVQVIITSIMIEGSQATVRLTRKDTIRGRAQPTFQQTIVLVKGPAGWTIREIGQ